MLLINTLDRSEKDRITVQERTLVSSQKTNKPSDTHSQKQEQHSSSKVELKNANLSVNKNPLHSFPVHAILPNLESQPLGPIQTGFDESCVIQSGKVQLGALFIHPKRNRESFQIAILFGGRGWKKC